MNPNRSFFILFFILFLTVSTKAQGSKGLSLLGIKAHTISYDNNDFSPIVNNTLEPIRNEGFNQTFGIGIWFEHFLTENISIRPEIDVTENFSSLYRNGPYLIRVFEGFTEVPVFLQYSYKTSRVSVRIGAAPYLGILNAQHFFSNNNYLPEPLREGYGFGANFKFGLVGDVALRIPVIPGFATLGIGFRYGKDLVNPIWGEEDDRIYPLYQSTSFYIDFGTLIIN